MNTIGSSQYDDGVVYYVTGDNVVAFNARNRSELWVSSFAFSGVGFPSLQLAGSFLFLLDGETVRLIDKNTGGVNWQTNVSQPANVTVLRNYVYILEGINRVIHAVDIESGEKTGSLRVSRPWLGFTDSQDLISVDGILLIANGNKLFGYGE